MNFSHGPNLLGHNILSHYNVFLSDKTQKSSGVEKCGYRAETLEVSENRLWHSPYKRYYADAEIKF